VLQARDRRDEAMVILPMGRTAFELGPENWVFENRARQSQVAPQASGLDGCQKRRPLRGFVRS